MMEPLIQGNQGDGSERQTDGSNNVEVPTDTETGAAAASNEDITDEITPPPIGSLVTGARFWWKFVQWPLLLAAINVIVLGCLLWSAGADIDDIFDNYNNDDDYSRSHHRKKQIGELSVVVLVIAILLLVDSFLMFRWAGIVQAQLDRLELEEEGVGSNESSSNIYGRVSKMADKFLAGGTSTSSAVVMRTQVLPMISLLVNVCYVGTT